MDWFKNRRTSFKINSLIIIMALFLGIVGYVGYHYTRQGNLALNETYTRLMSVKYTNDARANNRAGSADVLAIILTKDMDQKQIFQQDLHQCADNLDKALQLYKQIALDAHEHEGIEKVTSTLKAYRTERDNALQIDSTGDSAGAYDYFRENALPQLNEFTQLLEELADYNAQIADQQNKAFNQAFAAGTKIVIGLPLLAVILGLTLGFIISRLIAAPLKTMQNLMAKAENGDLTVLADIHSKDEAGELASSFNSMVNKIRQFINTVQQEAQTVAASSEEISVSSEQIAMGAQAQAEKTQSAAQMVVEITRIADNVAHSAYKATETADSTAQVTEEGNKIVNQTVEGMKEVSENILALDTKSERIGEIVTTIKGIADQTNLLSLNAAIEAARAGDAGKGFAVVADEVRKLAERTTASTKNIAELVKEIQTMTQKAVDSAKVGMELTLQTGKAFRTIKEQADTSASQINDIAGAAQTALKTAEKVSAEVQNMAAISEESSASLEQTAGAIQSMSDLAVNLQNEAAKFHIE